MKTLKKSYFLFAAVLLLIGNGCSSTEKKEKKYSTVVLSQEDFDSFFWREKAIYIDHVTALTANKGKAFENLLRYAFLQNQTEVMISVTDAIARLKLENLHDLLFIGIRNPNSMLRWHSLKALAALPLWTQDISTIALLIKDKEWLVRETAFRMIRNYPSEKNKKEYYYDVLTSLNDGNEVVLKQIYTTLYWYDDKRTFPYIYQRSFRTHNQIELVFILRELVKYDSPTVRKRLYFLSQKHADRVVRNEAQKLLESL